MPKPEDSHKAPKVELCEVMLDAIRASIVAGDIRAFYSLIAPELSQVGIDAPSEMPEESQSLGTAFVDLAKGEQARFIQRMGIVREYQRERWNRWNEKRKNASTDSQPLANAQPTDSKNKPSVGYLSTDTEIPNTEAEIPNTDTEAERVPKRARRRAREGAPSLFVPPSLEEVKAHVAEKGYRFDPAAFVAFYASKGRKVGNQPMKDWKAACVTWETRTKAEAKNKNQSAVNQPEGYIFHQEGGGVREGF